MPDIFTILRDRHLTMILMPYNTYGATAGMSEAYGLQHPI